MRHKPADNTPITLSEEEIEGSILCSAIPLGLLEFADSATGVGADPPFLAMPYGVWKHPKHGNLVFTPEKAKRMAENHTAGVYGPRLPINYGHDRAGRAAGWVKTLEPRADGMWVHPEWTPPGREAVKNGEYGYTSVEFYDVWDHPKVLADTGGADEQQLMRYRDVLIGVGLTNIPFLKGHAGDAQTEVHCAEFCGAMADAPAKDKCDDGGVIPQGGDEQPEEEAEEVDPSTGKPKKKKSKSKPVKKADDDEMTNCADPQGPRGAKLMDTFKKLLERLRGLPQDAKPEDVEVALSEVLGPGEEPKQTVDTSGDDKAMAELAVVKAQLAITRASLKEMAETSAADKATAAKAAAKARVEAAIGKKLAPAVREDQKGYDTLVALAESDPTGFDAIIALQPELPGTSSKGFGHQESTSAVTLSEADEHVCAEIAEKTGEKLEDVRKQHMEIVAARLKRETVRL